MSKIEFVGKLVAMGGLTAKGGVGGWTMIVIPKAQSAKLPSRGQVRVAGTINGSPFRTTAFPTGDGTHHITVNKAMREGAKIAQGDTARVSLAVDTAPRPVEVPAELRAALARSKPAKAAFEKMPPSHRREIAGFVAEAKKPETRARRAAQTVEKLASGEWRAR